MGGDKDFPTPGPRIFGRCPGMQALLLLVVFSTPQLSAGDEAPLRLETGTIDFNLTDHNNENFALRQLRGKLVLVFFGYTACPDVCPSELTSLAAVLRALGPQQDRVQALFISIDPQRDTPSQLKNYVLYFAPGLIGLTGSAAQIDQVADLFNAGYRRIEREDGRYFMDHSASLYVVDEKGRLVVAVPYGLPPEHTLQVVRGLLTETEATH